MDSKTAENSALHEIYVAGGCFWGVEEYFSRIPGVVETRVGYANGRTPYPDYRSVCSGQTGHAETVRVRYDIATVSLATLVRHFFRIIDPTSINRQGNDIGTQYRTGIYFENAEEEETIRASLLALTKEIGQPLAVECCPLLQYYTAEE